MSIAVDITAQQILRAIFLGPTSVGKSGWARRSGPRPLAMRLGLTSITPGAIAAAGIMVCTRIILYLSTVNWLPVGTFYYIS